MDKKFCMNCGTENPSNAKFCNRCGGALPIMEQQPIYPPVAPYQPPVQPPVMAGSGSALRDQNFGYDIVAVILSIFSLLMGLSQLVSAMSTREAYKHMAEHSLETSTVISYILYLCLPLTSVGIGTMAKNRGYENGLSKSAVALGIAAAAAMLIAFLLVATA